MSNLRVTLKKALCFIAALFLFTVTVSAESVSFSAGKEFICYQPSEASDRASKILGMTEAELQTYCTENDIVQLAVNKENTKQIRLTKSKSPFSESVGNISGLADSKITALMPDIIGDKSVKGEIIEKQGQKFIKTHISSADSGGDYTVLRYYTVADKSNITLSFYTSSDSSEEYAEKVFQNFLSDSKKTDNKKEFPYNYVIIAAMVLLAFASAYIIYTLIRDIKNDKETEEP